MKSLASIVLCAGKGTRMKSARAKVLHEVLGHPLGTCSIRRALEVGASPVVVVVGHQAEEVQKAFEADLVGAPVTFALQREQLGTAHAVHCGRPKIPKSIKEVLILYGDTPLIRSQTLAALVKAKRSRKTPVAMVTMVPLDPKGYGRVVRDDDGQVRRIVEDKDCTPEEALVGEVNAGLYLVDAAFLWKALERVGQKNSQREFYLTDLAELAFLSGKPVATVSAPAEEVGGVNDRVELARACTALRHRLNADLMRAGVTLDDPESTWIEEGVRIGPDTRIGAGCVLRGATTLGKNVRVGHGCVIQASSIGDGAQIKDYSSLDEAKVGKEALIGPFARLRPGTELADRVHVGNFVETKKAKIGKGSKANHLTYLGDCEIGAGVNVGAGTITCNYDGVHKHKTVLGDGVFVGSDSQFVAPITVGRGSYIAAGSTITEDVPPDSLALGRARQVTKKDYLKKRKAG
ncbi:MAG: bifunctional UDP-N-acetylglucosamine diphosphorylase/glucosamine-1-phosphate N-acetyltransferase GlmU [Deltaproteobacteria bacterium]|nr:bifunctional UDP-N-acetylglucosamine diphosphorylase/glucosamine-1-phosphate N-acetyltransferase GlmU [Deltaproteobacteria bacterium]